jgi:hypothetical protein
MFQAMNGYYTPVMESFTQSSPNGPISLTDPSNIFLLQNDVTNHINEFQTTYSRYLRCQDLTTAPNVSPACDTNGVDSFNNLDRVYHSLLDSIHKLDQSFDGQTDLDAITPKQYEENIKRIQTKYANILALRSKLDHQLQTLEETQPNTSSKILESAAFANTLWVVLASCLVYYIFIEM